MAKKTTAATGAGLSSEVDAGVTTKSNIEQALAALQTARNHVALFASQRMGQRLSVSSLAQIIKDIDAISKKLSAYAKN